MTRYFGLLSYDGTHYHGWQIQPNATTVQAILAERLSTKWREPLQITGAGRTDTGVHASYFVLHFDSSHHDLDTPKALHDINHFLPEDIRFHQLVKVTPRAHARFDATQRTYHYLIRQRQNPFLKDFSMWHPQTLDINAMNKAAGYLLSVNDFTSFSKLHTQTENNICEVRSAYFTPFQDGLVFQITANRFLRNMVRAVVGTLLEVGKRKLSYDAFCHIIEKKNRNEAGLSVPAKGLFLTNIVYPDQIFVEKPLRKPQYLFPLIPQFS